MGIEDFRLMIWGFVSWKQKEEQIGIGNFWIEDFRLRIEDWEFWIED